MSEAIKACVDCKFCMRSSLGPEFYQCREDRQWSNPSLVTGKRRLRVAFCDMERAFFGSDAGCGANAKYFVQRVSTWSRWLAIFGGIQ